MIAARNWERALEELDRMQADGEKPKLGSMQRWVRDCDAAGTEEPASLRVRHPAIGLFVCVGWS